MAVDLRSELARWFGFDDFRPGQEQAISVVLAGRSALVVMPTGGGKSLCYQLPAYVLPGTTVVISPLIALMKDQVDALVARFGGLATYVNSALPSEEQQRRLAGLARGQWKLVYVAPERLRSAAFLAAIQRTNVSLLAVDEAHCVSHWGHDFRPDYLFIKRFHTTIGAPPALALTATATVEVQDDILRQLGLGAAERIVTGFDRANLHLEVRYARDDRAKRRELQRLLSELEGPGIVYVGTRREADETAIFCQDLGLRCKAYHAGMLADERRAVQDAFMADELGLVAATNAFGMGIDKAALRYVIHYTVPATLEAYYQEAGRAGRDGKDARCVLIYSPEDRALQEWLIDSDLPGPGDVASVYKALVGDARDGWTLLSLEELETLSGVKEGRARVALSYLEIAGAIRRGHDQGGRMAVELTAKGIDAERFKRIDAHLAQRKARRHALLDIMIDYAETLKCRRRTILRYFGDPAAPATRTTCCDNCRARAAVPTGTGRLKPPAGFATVAANSSRQAPAPVGPGSSALEPGRPPAPRSTAAGDTVSDEAGAVGLTILDAVAGLRWPVGRGKLAEILKGSRAKSMTAYDYDKLASYGKLTRYSLEELEGLIDQLIEVRYLRITGSTRPVVSLSPTGLVAVRERHLVAVVLPERPPERPAAPARHHVGDTLEQTLSLYRAGRTPDEMARERELNIRTIYGHLAELIGRGDVDLDEIVPSDVQDEVRRAVAQVGTSFLRPIKDLCGEHVTYEQIRCVVAAWERRDG